MSGSSLAELERQHLSEPTNLQILDRLYHYSERVSWTFEGQTMSAWIGQCRSPRRRERWNAAQALARLGSRALPGILQSLHDDDDPGPYLPLYLMGVAIPEVLLKMVRAVQPDHPRRTRASLWTISASAVDASTKIQAISEIAEARFFFEVRRALLDIGDDAKDALSLFEGHARHSLEKQSDRFRKLSSELSAEFEESWTWLQHHFYEFLVEKDDWQWIQPLIKLMTLLRLLGYDRVLRAGQSLHLAMFSRSRDHGLLEGQDWLSIRVERNGSMFIRSLSADPDPIHCPRIELCDPLLDRLETLSLAPIT